MLDWRGPLLFAVVFLALFLLAILTRPKPVRTPALVQTGSGSSAPTDATVDGTWTGATTAGNLLVAVVTATNNAAITSITAPAGWVQAAFVANGALAYRAVAIFYYANAPSQSTTGDFTASAASTGCNVVLAEYSGCEVANVLDKTATNFTDTNTTAPDSGTTAATVQPHELCIAGFATGSNAVSDPTNSFALVVRADNTGAGGTNGATMEGKIVSAVGTQNCSVTAASQKWAGAIATFKAVNGSKYQPMTGVGG